MDHLTPGYRSRRLQRHHNVRTATWGFLGLMAGVVIVLCALVVPEGLIAACLLGGLMFGASR